ncbi:SDR family NAD(P)-dependent oxidoreductase [Streptomyces sp. NPDC005426]|uniref:SDR family NAD(P)-dependent oxidoreductase n=1 Tax=Streptomyces sp. NPDC005426 TaxID=3155344 RepID=UPI0033B724BB
MWRRTTPSPLTDQVMTWPGAHLGAGPSPCTRGCTTASILITGATNGLGLALAEEPAEAGHQVLLHGRHPQRPVPVAQRFGAEHYIADLSAPAETQRLAAEVAARHDRLDVLVNNAGVGFTWNRTIRSMSADGYQQRLAVNHSEPCAAHPATAAVCAWAAHHAAPTSPRSRRNRWNQNDTQHFDEE